MPDMEKKYKTQRKVVFAAMSKRNFFMREHIIKYILTKGYTPTCAFMMFSYYLLNTVSKKALITANNDLIRLSDQLWVFGNLSDGVMAEIRLAEKLAIPVRYFRIEKRIGSFKEINQSDIQIEYN